MAFPDCTPVCLCFLFCFFSSFIHFLLCNIVFFLLPDERLQRGLIFFREKEGAGGSWIVDTVSVVGKCCCDKSSSSLWRDEITLFQRVLHGSRTPPPPHHVDAVKESTDMKQLSCVNQCDTFSNGNEKRVKHSMQWLRKGVRKLQ